MFGRPVGMANAREVKQERSEKSTFAIIHSQKLVRGRDASNERWRSLLAFMIMILGIH